MKFTEVFMIAGGALLIYAGITDFQILNFLKALVVNPAAIKDINGPNRSLFYGTTDPLQSNTTNKPASASNQGGVKTV